MWRIDYMKATLQCHAHVTCPFIVEPPPPALTPRLSFPVLNWWSVISTHSALGDIRKNSVQWRNTWGMLHFIPQKLAWLFTGGAPNQTICSNSEWGELWHEWMDEWEYEITCVKRNWREMELGKWENPEKKSLHCPPQLTPWRHRDSTSGLSSDRKGYPAVSCPCSISVHRCIAATVSTTRTHFYSIKLGPEPKNGDHWSVVSNHSDLADVH